MDQAKDMAGQTFGRWLVLERAPHRDRRAHWRCRCECGREAVVTGYNLRSGASRSCGCLSRDTAQAAKTRHGHTRDRGRSPEHVVWSGMRNRCENPREPAYPRYGGRGITVCERWQTFENFYADMGPRPSLAHSIDRIDNDRGYEPGNCRWATRVEQNRNRRDRLRLTIDGETLTAAEWSERSGVSISLISGRVARGWSAREAVFTSAEAGRRRAEKLSPEQRATIIARSRSGEPFGEIARAFGVAPSYVSMLAGGRRGVERVGWDPRAERTVRVG